MRTFIALLISGFALAIGLQADVLAQTGSPPSAPAEQSEAAPPHSAGLAIRNIRLGMDADQVQTTLDSEGYRLVKTWTATPPGTNLKILAKRLYRLPDQKFAAGDSILVVFQRVGTPRTLFVRRTLGLPFDNQPAQAKLFQSLQARFGRPDFYKVVLGNEHNIIWLTDAAKMRCRGNDFGWRWILEKWDRPNPTDERGPMTARACGAGLFMDVLINDRKVGHPAEKIVSVLFDHEAAHKEEIAYALAEKRERQARERRQIENADVPQY